MYKWKLHRKTSSQKASRVGQRPHSYEGQAHAFAPLWHRVAWTTPLLAITHRLLLKSIYHPPLIENTHPLWFKKATRFKMEGHPRKLIGREEESPTARCCEGHIGPCLITSPSPVLKHLLSCFSIPPIIHHWSAVTKALGGRHENRRWYRSN